MANKPAAAMIPTCLIPPPRAFLTLTALAIKLLDPTMTDPIGAPSPLLKHTLTESQSLTSRDAGTLIAVAVLNLERVRNRSGCKKKLQKAYNRAPSQWIGKLKERQVSAN